jgi:choice-of-anchor C domain-containing protein
VRHIGLIVALALLGLPVCLAAPIFTDSFENPGCSSCSFLTLNTGALIGPWTVGPGSVDYIGTYWQAHSGQYSVDLAGNEEGSVYTTLPTVAGEIYVLTFFLAGNPDQSTVKTVNVTVGNQNQQFTFDNTGGGYSPGNMGWTQQTLSFTASGSDVLTFTAVGTGAWGPAIDSVSVESAPEPGTYMLAGAGLLALGLLRKRS